MPAQAKPYRINRDSSPEGSVDRDSEQRGNRPDKKNGGSHEREEPPGCVGQLLESLSRRLALLGRQFGLRTPDHDRSHQEDQDQ
jgi:hypothetical protein